MDLYLLGLLSEYIGSVFIAFTALMVHHRILNEHTVDQKVLTTMRTEQVVGVLGVIFITIGFGVQLWVRYG